MDINNNFVEIGIDYQGTKTITWKRSEINITWKFHELDVKDQELFILVVVVVQENNIIFFWIYVNAILKHLRVCIHGPYAHDWMEFMKSEYYL